MRKIIILAIAPALICALILFLAKSWVESIATRDFVVENYVKSADLEKKFATSSDYKIMASDIAALDKKVDQIHDDLRQLMIYFASKDVSFNDKLIDGGFYKPRCVDDVPAPGDGCKKDKTEIAKNGG